MKTIHSLFSAFALLLVFRLLDRQLMNSETQRYQATTSASILSWSLRHSQETAIFRLHLD